MILSGLDIKEWTNFAYSSFSLTNSKSTGPQGDRSSAVPAFETCNEFQLWFLCVRFCQWPCWSQGPGTSQSQWGWGCVYRFTLYYWIKSHRQCSSHQLWEKLLVTQFVGKEQCTRSPNTCLLEFAVPLNNSVTLGKSLTVRVCFSVDGGRWITLVLYTLWAIDLLAFGNISWEKLRILGKFYISCFCFSEDLWKAKCDNFCHVSE